MNITPTVGRKVWFYDPISANAFSQNQPFDATVIYVWSETMVDLLVTDHAGKQRVESSVTLRMPLGGECHGVERIATWMPYQVGHLTKAA